MSFDPHHIPNSIEGLSKWFYHAVNAELQALEKNSGMQTYEVHSGQLIQPKDDNEGLFAFNIADGTRIPEDSSGKLKTESQEFMAQVTRQEGSTIALELKGRPMPSGIHWGRLLIDDTALLKSLSETLEKCSEGSKSISALGLSVFYPLNTSVMNKSLPDSPHLNKITGELRGALEQAAAAPVTYIWGPPGTGKTFAIAHLITAMLEAGKRVMITSHTNSAVNQALCEAVKEGGPLADHALVNNGQLLRIGHSEDPRVPDYVRYDKVLEAKGHELNARIADIETQIRALQETIDRRRSTLAAWDKLDELQSHLEKTNRSLEDADAKKIDAEETIKNNRQQVDQYEEKLENARKAWFRRHKKIEKAEHFLDQAKEALTTAENALDSVAEQKKKIVENRDGLQNKLEKQETACAALPKRKTIEKEIEEKSGIIKNHEKTLEELHEEYNKIGKSLIDNAQAIFCTLTKNYAGDDIADQQFDAVIIDEISMALPPLLFLAAGRAKSHTVLVGDFLQLPPIVRSNDKISNAVLGRDTFHLAGVAKDMKPAEPCPVLKKLEYQRRMLPAIADVARHLVYKQAGGLEDHETVKNRSKQDARCAGFLCENPLLIIDTADFYCWSGKQPGSLSRFNIYSAKLAVDVAALAARHLERASPGESQPIAIITPFAAQRRLLSNLIADMGLDPWVGAGTVHTFQGNQAELIIFDSVLDEPYYTARLCDPKAKQEVLRDLNVAVTRARNKFVFIGSSAWLNKQAKPASALGHLWHFLKRKADLISGLELMGADFPQSILSRSPNSTSWDIPQKEAGETIQILDEASFFDYFAEDINACKASIFALAPFFGEYRWPQIQPLFNAALSKGVAVTVVTPPLSEAKNKSYVEGVISNLRSLGAVVVTSSGLHGKDVIIDEKIVYTGSMNWSSHRGRSEIVHRVVAPKYAEKCLDFLQAKHIRQAARDEDGAPRTCPKCGSPIQIVNQRRQHFQWDTKAMKIGCTNPDCKGYLRDIDERSPLKKPPVCESDGRTKYRRVKRGKGQVWQCPKHPKKCKSFKVVPGDPD